MYLQATIFSKYEKNFNCYHCKRTYAKAQDYDARRDEYTRQTEMLREQKGCFGPPKSGTYAIENIKFATCIGNYSDPTVSYFVEAYRRFQQGVMPYPGSYFQQPAKAIDLFRIIGQLMDENEERARKKEDDDAHAKMATSRAKSPKMPTRGRRWSNKLK